MLLGKLSKTISIFCFISTIIIGQDDFKRVGKSGFGFLKISPSARAAGMGDAFTAIADDVTTIFYNPAGLTNLNQFVFNFNHTDWIVNSSIISGAIAKPFGRNGAIGFSIVKFDTEDFEETTVLDPEGTGRMIDAGDLALAIAYAIKLTDNLSFGFKTQYLEEKIDIDTATASIILPVPSGSKTVVSSKSSVSNLTILKPIAPLRPNGLAIAPEIILELTIQSV
jgi:hypothetical protein